MRNFQKGWATFEALAMRFAQDARYAFYQFGVAQGAAAIPGHVRHVPVQVSREQPDAMIEALAEHAIDVAVVWSVWPETFCYTAHEALAAGVFVLTHPGAGHVAATVAHHAPDQGLVIEDEAGLQALFADGAIEATIAAARRRRGVLVPEGGTAAWTLLSAEGRRLRRGEPHSAAAPVKETPALA
jgi:hypothetical protein